MKAFFHLYGDDMCRSVAILATGTAGFVANLSIVNEVLRAAVAVVTIISLLTMLYFAWVKHNERKKDE